MPLPAFLPHIPLRPSATHRRPRNVSKCAPRMTSVPLQERVLRLERALAAAVSQERYSDAATLRDALEAVRHADPVLAKRDELRTAVQGEDFLAAARIRDELARLTERFSRADAGRKVDRIIVLRGRGTPENALRVSTVSREGHVQLSLLPEPDDRRQSPRVYLQPTWSPSGDFVAMTEISFNIETPRFGRAIVIADSSSRVVVMNAFDGSVVKSVPLSKPPFFYYWSPDGRCVTLLSNDPTSPATTVAVSVLQVVAPPGGGGLDPDTVTGPLASGHPFLFDFCPRDSSRMVAHMGDKTAVSIVPVSPFNRTHTVLTTEAGSFGAPQWHPQVGSDGREVVFFVEQDSASIPSPSTALTEPAALNNTKSNSDNSSTTETDDKKGLSDIGVGIDNFISNSSTILENAFRKGVESLGIGVPAKAPNDQDSSNGADEKGSKSSDFPEQFRRLLPNRPPLIRDFDKWGEGLINDQAMSRLVMCDANAPEIRRVIARFSGVMAFKLSPDGSAMATLVTNPATGQDELTICSGDFSPDSVVETENPFSFRQRRSALNEADVVLSTPYTRVVAFFWSPDSKKLLFLTSLRGSRVGAVQWATFDKESNKVVRYEKFVISSIYMHCLNFFDQFASSMTPWSPDSDAFCYPGRSLTQSEVDRETEQSVSESPALSALLMQREGVMDGKLFSARVQKVAPTGDRNVEPEDATIIVDNVEYACWSPC